MDQNTQRGECSMCKKWTLFSVPLIIIIWCMVLVASAPKLDDIYTKYSKSKEITDKEKV